mgnify:CR=1 FL=1
MSVQSDAKRYRWYSTIESMAVAIDASNITGKICPCLTYSKTDAIDVIPYPQKQYGI